MKAINQDNGQILASRVEGAYTFIKRLRGLLFTKSLPNGDALHIQPCRSVHTFLMNYAIDILYLDKHQKVIGMDESLQPGQTGRKFRQTYSVIELPLGIIKETNTQVGQTVILKNENEEEML